MSAARAQVEVGSHDQRIESGSRQPRLALIAVAGRPRTEPPAPESPPADRERNAAQEQRARRQPSGAPTPARRPGRPRPDAGAEGGRGADERLRQRGGAIRGAVVRVDVMSRQAGRRGEGGGIERFFRDPSRRPSIGRPERRASARGSSSTRPATSSPTATWSSGRPGDGAPGRRPPVRGRVWAGTPHRHRRARAGEAAPGSDRGPPGQGRGCGSESGCSPSAAPWACPRA